MGIFDKFKNTKSLPEKPQTEELSKNMYVELGIIEPFTLLVGKQFNSFVAELAKNKSGILNDIEKKPLMYYGMLHVLILMVLAIIFGI